MVCCKRLYNYIERGLLKVRNIDLTLKVKRKQRCKVHPQHKRLYGQRIEVRPQVVNQRKEFGHWEIDTVVDRKESQSVLLTLDERTTRFRHIIKIPGRSTQAVEQGLKTLRELYGEQFSQVFRSITSDNGSEFASQPQLLPTISIYYTHPYSAYEHGLNEKQNSLVRRFLPKGRSFDVVTDEQLREIQDWINQLPESLFITVRRRNYYKLSYLILQSSCHFYVEAFGFSLLSMLFACKASEPLRSKKPPAMRVEIKRLTKRNHLSVQ